MTHRTWVLLAALGMTAGCGGEEESVPPAAGVVAIPRVVAPKAPEFPSVPGAWTQQASGVGEDLTAVAALDENRAWVADKTGHLYRTEDGGATWVFRGLFPWLYSPLPFPHDFPPKVIALHFVDDLHGWAVSPLSVMSTSDGGVTWTVHFETWHSMSSPYASVQFISPTTGWVVSPMLTSRTTDGGATWSPVQVAGKSVFGRAVHFVDSQNGWLAASNKLYKTADQGDTWQLHGSLDPGSHITDLTAVDDAHAWVLADGHLFGTTDGSAWNVQPVDDSSRIQFVDAAHGWAVGKKILHTSNGGAAWTVQTTPFSGFNGAVFVNASVGWIVGDDGLILKTETGGR